MTDRAGLALGLALAALACGGSDRPAPARAVEEGPPWRVRGPGGLEPIEPGTRDAELLRAGACAGCHAAEHAEWAKSRHAAAWTNGIFQREYGDVPRRWCVHCHAPLTPQVAEVVAAAGAAPATSRRQRHATAFADEGVSCAACHVRTGRIVARRRGSRSPHDTLVRDDFGSAAFCADCHQFSFPRFDRGREPVGLTAHPMQDTVAQFRRGPFGKASHGCLDCHGSAAGHAFRGGHDLGMLRGALTHALCRDGERVVLSISNVGAGHAVPTGDVHRHLAARLWRASAPESLADVFIGRQFENDPAGGRRTIWDSTLPPGVTRSWRFAIADLGGEPDEPIQLELRYVYTADEVPRSHRDPGEATSMVIAEDSRAPADIPSCAGESELSAR